LFFFFPVACPSFLHPCVRDWATRWCGKLLFLLTAFTCGFRCRDPHDDLPPLFCHRRGILTPALESQSFFFFSFPFFSSSLSPRPGLFFPLIDFSFLQEPNASIHRRIVVVLSPFPSSLPSNGTVLHPSVRPMYFFFPLNSVPVAWVTRRRIPLFRSFLPLLFFLFFSCRPAEAACRPDSRCSLSVLLPVCFPRFGVAALFFVPLWAFLFPPALPIPGQRPALVCTVFFSCLIRCLGIQKLYGVTTSLFPPFPSHRSSCHVFGKYVCFFSAF